MSNPPARWDGRRKLAGVICAAAVAVIVLGAVHFTSGSWIAVGVGAGVLVTLVAFVALVRWVIVQFMRGWMRLWRRAAR